MTQQLSDPAVSANMEHANFPAAVRDFVPEQEPGMEWNAMEHLSSEAYALYLVKWGKTCYASDEWIQDKFPEVPGIPLLDLHNWPDNVVWILEARGPNIRVGANFLQRPLWIWSKLVNILFEWDWPTNNVFIHDNEPQRGPLLD